MRTNPALPTTSLSSLFFYPSCSSSRLILSSSRRRYKVRKSSSLQIVNDSTSYTRKIGLPPLRSFPDCLARSVRNSAGLFSFHTVHSGNVLGFHTFQNTIHVMFWHRKSLRTNDTFQYLMRFRVVRVVHHTGTIDKMNTFHQCHVLPYLRFTRNRCSLAHFFVRQSVDYTTLSDVGYPSIHFGLLFSLCNTEN